MKLKIRFLPFFLFLSVLSTAGMSGRPLVVKKRTWLSFADGVRIHADVAESAEEREKGLMYRTKLPRNYGMLFVFPEEAPRIFWMKNTLVPLDIVFVGADKRITEIFKSVKASTLRTPDADVARVEGTAQFVLELPVGAAARHHLSQGQSLSFKADIPSF